MYAKWKHCQIGMYHFNCIACSYILIKKKLSQSNLLHDHFEIRKCADKVAFIILKAGSDKARKLLKYLILGHNSRQMKFIKIKLDTIL